MKTPLQELREKKNEISAIYKHVLSIEYGNSTGGGSHNSVHRAAFNEDKAKDLKKINDYLTQYTEAIDSLKAIKNGTF